MQNATIVTTVIILLLVGGLVWFYWPGGDTGGPLSNNENTQANSTSSTGDSQVQLRSRGELGANEGRVSFRVTDAATSLDGIKSVVLVTNGVEIHSATKGWMTVSSDVQAYDLVALKKSGNALFLADVNLDAGTYDQVRLSVERVRVIRSDGRVEEARMPTGTVLMNTKLVVAKGENSGITFDFLLDKSLQTAQNGSLVFMPVVQLDTKSIITTIQFRGVIVDFIEGQSDSDVTYGMDETGTMKVGFTVGANVKIDLIGNTVRIIP